jgi:hypothetical protein
VYLQFITTYIEGVEILLSKPQLIIEPTFTQHPLSMNPLFIILLKTAMSIPCEGLLGLKCMCYKARHQVTKRPHILIIMRCPPSNIMCHVQLLCKRMV